MMKRALLQAEILEKLGAPLVEAVSEVAARDGQQGAASPREEAQKTAALLGKAVQLGTMIAAKANVKGADESAESVRAVLTALSGRMVADYYRRTARMPEEGDLKKIASSLEATLAFSDNFVASEETAARISQMSAGAVYADENQLLAQFASALAPVINAAAAFPFGQPEAALVQRVAERLTEKAGILARGGFGEEGAARPDTAALAELTILKALVSIYVACHYEGIEQLKKQNAPPEPAPADPMARVWDMFEKRAAMMDMLAKYIVQERSGQASTVEPAAERASAAPQDEGSTPPSVQNQSMNIPPMSAPAPSTPPPAAEKAPEENKEESQNANPMSFFGSPKKSEDGDE